MDAFAVAAIIGITLVRLNAKTVIIVGLYFGIFQGVMPFIGYLAASRLVGFITAISHWIAFAVLAALGIKMIFESYKNNVNNEKPRAQASLAPMAMLPLAFGTSVDALAAGVPLAFLYVDIVPAVLFIGVVTFVMSMAGVYMGNAVGTRFQSKANLAGGVMLILIGVWLLVK